MYFVNYKYSNIMSFTNYKFTFQRPETDFGIAANTGKATSLEKIFPKSKTGYAVGPGVYRESPIRKQRRSAKCPVTSFCQDVVSSR